jgi:hypothetical protein
MWVLVELSAGAGVIWSDCSDVVRSGGSVVERSATGTDWSFLGDDVLADPASVRLAGNDPPEPSSGWILAVSVGEGERISAGRPSRDAVLGGLDMRASGLWLGRVATHTSATNPNTTPPISPILKSLPIVPTRL